ncbi:MAG: acyl-CoA thioesterase [Bacteroidia bacterium]|nr:acyl-CoA thioesterase [Bacteroidia bacterium]
MFVKIFNPMDKTPLYTLANMTELVLPNDTNTLGNLMGGRLLHWMDIVTAISASKHSNRVVVTASVDFVDFQSPIKLGEIVILEAKVTRAFKTSMEVMVKVWAQNLQSTEKRSSNQAFYTFVAVDQTGRPIPVDPVHPETEEEKELYESAMRRRELRLISAKRMKPEDAVHLKKIFLT